MSINIAGALQMIKSNPNMCKIYSPSQLQAICMQLGIPPSANVDEMCRNISAHLIGNPQAVQIAQTPVVQYAPTTNRPVTSLQMNLSQVIAPIMQGIPTSSQLKGKGKELLKSKEIQKEKQKEKQKETLKRPREIITIDDDEEEEEDEDTIRTRSKDRKEKRKQQRQPVRKEPKIYAIDDDVILIEQPSQTEQKAQKEKRDQDEKEQRQRSRSNNQSLCQLVDLKTNTFKLVPRDILDGNRQIQRNIGYITDVLRKLPNCSSVVNATNQNYEHTLKMLKTAIKLQNSGAYFFKDSGDVSNEIYIQCFVRDVLGCMRNPSVDNYPDPFYTLLNESRTNRDINDRKFLRLKAVGELGKFGQVFFVSVNDTQNQKYFEPFSVLKYSNSQENEEIINELAIGFALNTLRGTIPYFSYTYGGFYCTTQASKNKLLTCTSEDDDLVAMSLQQFVKDGTSLDKLLLKMYDDGKDKDEILKTLKDVMIQVGYALMMAQKEYKYVHFDLHADNVILRKLPTPTTIELRLNDNKKVKLQNVKYYPTIIDFGKNALTLPNKTFISTISTPMENPEMIDDLNSDKKNYFVSGFDIYRYVTCVLADVWDGLVAEGAKPSGSLLTGINNFFLQCMKEFGDFNESKKRFEGRISSSNYLKNLFRLAADRKEKALVSQVYSHNKRGGKQQKPLLDLWAGAMIADQNNVQWGQAEDADMFQIDMQKWIQKVDQFEL